MSVSIFQVLRAIENNNESIFHNITCTGKIFHCNTRQRIQPLSPDSYNEFVLCLREELDSNKEKIKFLKLEHGIIQPSITIFDTKARESSNTVLYYFSNIFCIRIGTAPWDIFYPDNFCKTF